VIETLRAGLDPERADVRLNTVALELRWRRRTVTLLSRTGTGRRLEPLHAKAAVIALPHAVLRAGDLRFRPALPEKERAARRLEVGQVFRIVLRFRAAFWEDDRFVRTRLGEEGDLGFIHGVDEEVPVWWTPLPARAPILTGWAGGPKAERLLDRTPEMRLDRSLDSLARILSVARRSLDEGLERASFHDWRSDPWSRGAYSYVGVGGLTAQRTLARPVEETLFFAGDALDPDEMGTVGGALTSGRRAGTALVRSLS
jgi:monoamine oxidase